MIKKEIIISALLLLSVSCNSNSQEVSAVNNAQCVYYGRFNENGSMVSNKMISVCKNGDSIPTFRLIDPGKRIDKSFTLVKKGDSILVSIDKQKFTTAYLIADTTYVESDLVSSKDNHNRNYSCYLPFNSKLVSKKMFTVLGVALPVYKFHINVGITSHSFQIVYYTPLYDFILQTEYFQHTFIRPVLNGNDSNRTQSEIMESLVQQIRDDKAFYETENLPVPSVLQK